MMGEEKNVGAGLETLLTVLVPIVLVIVWVAYMFRNQFKRILTYIEAWKRRDEEIELEEKLCRERAKAELEELERVRVSKQENGND